MKIIQIGFSKKKLQQRALVVGEIKGLVGSFPIYLYTKRRLDFYCLESKIFLKLLLCYLNNIISETF